MCLVGKGGIRSSRWNVRMYPQDMRIFQKSKRCHEIGDGQCNRLDILWSGLRMDLDQGVP